jgi:hypothetical protein
VLQASKQARAKESTSGSLEAGLPKKCRLFPFRGMTGVQKTVYSFG